MTNKKHCGYISIIGKPNVGKSTLLNNLIGQKLSITSRKPQTTRHQFLGIKTIENYQLIFKDTPGIHSDSKNQMNRFMNKTARNSIIGVDIVLYLIDGLKFTQEDENIAKYLEKITTPIVLVINKIDKINDKNLLLPFIEKITQKITFSEICYISALKKIGLNQLQKEIKKNIPEGIHIFDNDDITTQSTKFISAERIREKLTRRLGDELPYSLTVSIESFEETQTLSKIHAVIWLTKESQKKIVIGKNGNMLKSIGTDARLELEQIIGTKVFLKLWVKVKKGWNDDVKTLQNLGYDEKWND